MQVRAFRLAASGLLEARTPRGTFCPYGRFLVPTLAILGMAILTPSRNVWRIEPASRASVIIDAAAYFQAVREACLKAQRSIFVLGWDIDSRTRLVGPAGDVEDGYPVQLADFLSALAKERPQLQIQLLLWDYSVLYSLEREPFPMVNLQWNTADGVRLALDNCVPFGCSQHQKIVLIDDAIAFSGGLDLTIARWDTPAHEAVNPHRVTPKGVAYRPFHDVQIAVDGEAARALAGLARARWRAATSEDVPLVSAGCDPWPSSLKPDFTDVDVGIARTQPSMDEDEGIREVEQLFVDSIAAAERSIYIENQFLTSLKVGQALALRMKERPELEALIVLPLNHDSWLAESTMQNGRLRFTRLLAEAGVSDRARVVYPYVAGPPQTHTMVHSKVMVVDDRFLRVGSANINNRSMGSDTECDLVIEAQTDGQRDSISNVRNRLLADHCGVTPLDVADLLRPGASLIEASRKLSGNGHALRELDDGAPEVLQGASYIEGIADPEQPLEQAAFIALVVGDRAPRRSLRTYVKIAAVALFVLGLTLLWQFTPLSELASPTNIEAAMSSVSNSPWSAAIVIAAFVAGGLIAFPVNLLIAATAAAFGPIVGFFYAAAGTMLSALVTFAIGAWLGRKTVIGLLGPRLNRIRKGIARRGILAIAAIRLVPVAPFTVVNVAAGASEIRLFDYLVGTALGMAPGLLIMSALGHNIVLIFTEPSLKHFALLIGAIALWIALILGLQATVQRFRGAAS